MALLVLNFKWLWHQVSGTQTDESAERNELGLYFVYSFNLLTEPWWHWIPLCSGSWQRRPFSLVLRGLILDALSVFSFWVGARGCMHGTVNSRGCPCSALFRSELIYECQATAELGTCWWAGEACWLCTYDKLCSCWVGHMLGWESSKGAKHWERLGVSSRSRKKRRH